MSKLDHKKKILFLITKSNWGGAQRYVYDLASQLDQTQFSITVATGGTGKKGALPGTLYKKLTADSINVQYLPALQRSINPLQEFRAAWQILSCIKTTQPNIIHLNSSKMMILGGVIARLVGIPKIVITVHGFPYTNQQSLLIRWLADQITSFAFLCATDIICICRSDLTRAEKFWSTKNKLHLVPNGISISSDTEKTTARQKLLKQYPVLRNVSPDTLLLGTGTELHPRKGIQHVLKASEIVMSKHTNFHICICGVGSYEQELRAYSAQLNLSDRVTFLGFVDDLPNIVAAFDGFILVSHKEGLPYIVLEAASREVPLIASNVDGIPDIITHEETGQLIDPDNTESLVQALVALLTKPEDYRVQAKKLARKVKQSFSIQEMVVTTKSIYSQKNSAVKDVSG